jgi:hypothetical protein
MTAVGEISRLREHPELREALDARDWNELEVAFLDAVKAFAQYAEDRNDPSDEAVVGFALGFLQGAKP